MTETCLSGALDALNSPDAILASDYLLSTLRQQAASDPTCRDSTYDPSQGTYAYTTDCAQRIFSNYATGNNGHTAICAQYSSAIPPAGYGAGSMYSNECYNDGPLISSVSEYGGTASSSYTTEGGSNTGTEADCGSYAHWNGNGCISNQDYGT